MQLWARVALPLGLHAPPTPHPLSTPACANGVRVLVPKPSGASELPESLAQAQCWCGIHWSGTPAWEAWGRGRIGGGVMGIQQAPRCRAGRGAGPVWAGHRGAVKGWGGRGGCGRAGEPSPGPGPRSLPQPLSHGRRLVRPAGRRGSGGSAYLLAAAGRPWGPGERRGCGAAKGCTSRGGCGSGRRSGWWWQWRPEPWTFRAGAGLQTRYSSSPPWARGTRARVLKFTGEREMKAT